MGYPVTVHNRTRDKAERLRPLGARIAPSPSEAAEGADVIVVGDDSQLETASLGEKGILETIRPSATHVEMSTVSRSTTLKLAKEVNANRKCDQQSVIRPLFH